MGQASTVDPLGDLIESMRPRADAAPGAPPVDPLDDMIEQMRPPGPVEMRGTIDQDEIGGTVGGPPSMATRATPLDRVVQRMRQPFGTPPDPNSPEFQLNYGKPTPENLLRAQRDADKARENAITRQMTQPTEADVATTQRDMPDLPNPFYPSSPSRVTVGIGAAGAQAIDQTKKHWQEVARPETGGALGYLMGSGTNNPVDQTPDEAAGAAPLAPQNLPAQTLMGIPAMVPGLADPDALIAMALTHGTGNLAVSNPATKQVLAAIEQRLGPRVAQMVGNHIASSAGVGAFSAAQTGVEGGTPGQMAESGLKGAESGVLFAIPGDVAALRGPGGVAPSPAGIDQPTPQPPAQTLEQAVAANPPQAQAPSAATPIPRETPAPNQPPAASPAYAVQAVRDGVAQQGQQAGSEVPIGQEATPQPAPPVASVPAEAVAASPAPPTTPTDLTTLSYRELQARAKAAGIPANQSRPKLVQQLAATSQETTHGVHEQAAAGGGRVEEQGQGQAPNAPAVQQGQAVQGPSAEPSPAAAQPGPVGLQRDPQRSEVLPAGGADGEGLLKQPATPDVADPVRISGREISDRPSGPTPLEIVRHAADSGVRGAFFQNAQSGEQWKVTKRTITHAISDARGDPDARRAIAAIPEIIRRAEWVQTDPSRAGDQPNLTGFRRFEAPIEIDGRPATAQLQVKTFDQREQPVQGPTGEITELHVVYNQRLKTNEAAPPDQRVGPGGVPLMPDGEAASTGESIGRGPAPGKGNALADRQIGRAEPTSSTMPQDEPVRRTGREAARPAGVDSGKATADGEIPNAAPNAEQEPTASGFTPTAARKVGPRSGSALTRDQIERLLVDRHEAFLGGHDAAEGTDQEGYGMGTGKGRMTFFNPSTPDGNLGIGAKWRLLPGEIRDAFTPKEADAAGFQVSARRADAGAEDFAHEFGWEKYIARAKADAAGEVAGVGAAKDFFRDNPTDPEAAFYAALHDTLPAKGAAKGMTTMDPAALKAGDTFTVRGREVEVVKRGKGENAYLVLKDHNDLPETPVGAMGKVPVDKGTLEKGTEPGRRGQNIPEPKTPEPFTTPGKMTPADLKAMREGALTGKLRPVNREGGAPDATPTKPSIADRITAAADKAEAAARERMAKRQIPRGRNTGAAISPIDELRDIATIAAAKAVRFGAKGAIAIGKYAGDAIAQHAPHLKDRAKDVTSLASRLLRESRGPKGIYDADKFEQAVGRMNRPATQRAAEVKGQVREATGQAKPPDTVSEPEALAAGMKKAEKASAEGYRAGADDARKVARAKLDDLRETLTKAAHDKTKLSESMRSQALDAADVLPRTVRGNVLRQVARADTPTKLMKATQEIVRQYDIADGSKAAAKIKDLTTRSALRELTEDRRGRVKILLPGMDAVVAQLKNGTPEETSIANQRIKEVRDTIVALHHEQKQETKLANAKLAMTVAEVKKSIVESLARKRPVAPGELPTGRKAGWSRRYYQNNQTMDSIARDIDNKPGRAAGPAHELLVAAPQRAENAIAGHMRSVTEKIDQIAKETGAFPGGFAEASRRLAGSLGDSNRDTVDAKVGDHGKITKDQALTLAFALDDDAQRRLDRKTLGVFRSDPHGTAFKMDGAARQAIAAKLSAEEREFVQRVKSDVFEKINRPAVFDAITRIRGVEPEEVRNYFPIKIDAKKADYNVPENMLPTGDMLALLENAGMVRPREGGGQFLSIPGFLEETMRHSEQAAKIAHLAEPYLDARKSVMQGEARDAIGRAMGPDVLRRIDQTWDALANTRRYDPTSVDGWARKLNRNAARAMTSINWRTWAKHLGGTVTLANEFSPRDLGAATKDIGSAKVKELLGKSPYFWATFNDAPHTLASGIPDQAVATKSVGLANALKAAGNSLLHLSPGEAAGNLGKAADAIHLAGYFFAYHARLAMSAALQEGTRLGKKGADLDAFAMQRAEEAYRRTANTYSPTDSSGFQLAGRKSVVAQAFGAFTSVEAKRFNIMREAMLSKDAKRITTAAASLALSTLIGAAVTGGSVYGLAHLGKAITANSAGDTAARDRALHNAAWAFARDTAGTAGFGLNRFVEAVQGATSGYGGGSETPATGEVGKITEAVTLAIKTLSDEMADRKDPTNRQTTAAEKYWKAASKAMGGARTLVGDPTVPITQDIGTVYRAATRTHVQDLMDERKKLEQVPKDKRTDEEWERWGTVEKFFTKTYSPMRSRINKLRAAGDKDAAAEMESDLNDAAKEYASRLRSPALTKSATSK